MTEFMKLRRLEKHFERNHETFWQEDRCTKRGGLPESDEHISKRKKLGGDEDMEEMYGGSIKGDILNHWYKCKTCGDLLNYRKYRQNNNEDNDGKSEDNEDYDSQSEGSVDESEGWENQSEMTDD